MRKLLVIIAAVAMLATIGGTAQATPSKPQVTSCDLRVVKPTGANSVITADAHITCFGSTARLYLYVCVFYSSNGNDFSNAYDIGCSDNVYRKGSPLSWFSWTCGPCDHLGPHHETDFNHGKGYYWSWAHGLCPSCTPQEKAGPSRSSCYYNGSVCS